MNIPDIRKLAGEYDSKLVGYLEGILDSPDVRTRYTNEHLFCETVIEMMEKEYSPLVIEFYDKMYSAVVAKKIKEPEGLARLLDE